jgi:hypothetical protein
MGRLTKEKKTRLKFLKSEINQPKHALIELEKELEKISPKEASKLSKIIWKLEAFQNE